MWHANSKTAGIKFWLRSCQKRCKTGDGRWWGWKHVNIHLIYITPRGRYANPKNTPSPSSSSPPQPTKAFKHEHRADLSRGVKCQGRRNYGDDNSNSFGATFDGQRSAHGSARRESWRFEVGAWLWFKYLESRYFFSLGFSSIRDDVCVTWQLTIEKIISADTPSARLLTNQHQLTRYMQLIVATSHQKLRLKNHKNPCMTYLAKKPNKRSDFQTFYTTRHTCMEINELTMYRWADLLSGK